jgi:NADPH:quinone reductase-like Zn-dependent oxidoreductase
MRLLMGIRRPRNPILGMYFAGEVEAVGPAVKKFKPGDALYGSTRLRLGTYGEYVCLPESYTLTTKPHNLSFAEAAAVPLGGWNALHFMRKARLQPGETVLVNGAGGSIGTFAVQIAKTMGAEVTAVDSAIKEVMLRGIGADHFIDYATEDYTGNGRTYDVIFNLVAQNDYARSIQSLKPKGRYLTANPKVSDMLRSVLTSQFTDKTVTVAFAGETLGELNTLKEMIEAGKIRPIVDRVYPMEEAAEAHRRVETEQRLGTIVISG